MNKIYAVVVSSSPGLPAVRSQRDACRPAQGVVLRFRYWGDFKEIAVIQQTIEPSSTTTPASTVHGERVTASGDEYVQKLLVEQAAGLTPDVIFCGGNYASLRRPGNAAGPEALCPARPVRPALRLLPTAHPRLQQRADKLYALPRDIAPIGLVYYNKTLFDKAHIPYPDGSWRWDYQPHPERGNKDFLTVAQKLTHHAACVRRHDLRLLGGRQQLDDEQLHLLVGRGGRGRPFQPDQAPVQRPARGQGDPAHAGPDGQVQRVALGHRAGLVGRRLARAVRAGPASRCMSAASGRCRASARRSAASTGTSRRFPPGRPACTASRPAGPATRIGGDEQAQGRGVGAGQVPGRADRPEQPCQERPGAARHRPARQFPAMAGQRAPAEPQADHRGGARTSTSRSSAPSGPKSARSSPPSCSWSGTGR